MQDKKEVKDDDQHDSKHVNVSEHQRKMSGRPNATTVGPGGGGGTANQKTFQHLISSSTPP
jgi:hypothetical protein